MSYKATMSKKVQVNEKKFCKMCFDAKRDGYDTHYLKDFTGPEVKVVCPYLLGLQCNYCKEQGHTISYCPILKTKGTVKPVAKHEPRKNETGTGGAGTRIYSLYTEVQAPYPAKDWLFDREASAYIRIPPPPRLVRQNAIVVENEDEDYQNSFKTQPKTKTQRGNTVKTTNAYETLFSDSDDEEMMTTVAAATATAVAVMAPPQPQTESKLWAQIAAKVPPAPVATVAVQQKKRVQFQETTESTQSVVSVSLPELPSFSLKKKAPLSDAFFKYTPMSNWADDSEDDE